MRRTFLGWLAMGVAGGILLPGRRTLANTSSVERIETFDALRRPALRSAKAAGVAMLAVVHAGKRLVAMGERGVVLLSDDDGQTWRQASVPADVTLTAMYFVDEKQGWAVGHLGVVLHTTDGGEQWSLQLDGQRAAKVALEAAQKRGGEGAAKGVAAATALVEDGPDKPFLDVYFENARTGYVVGAYNLVFRTEDGGRSWQSWMGHLSNPKGLHLYAIRKVGSALYLAGEQGLLLRSSDGGQSFTPLASPSKGTYFGLVAGREGELVLYGLQGRAFLSGDAAQSWSEVDTGTRTSLSAGICLADGRLLLTSQAGELLMSRDGGRSFKAVPNGIGLPITALVQTPSGRLAVATMRGMRTVEVPASAS